MAAWFPDMFCNFYRVKNHKIAKNSTTTKARDKISTDFEILRITEKFDVFSCNWVLNEVDTDKSSSILISLFYTTVCLTKFKNN